MSLDPRSFMQGEQLALCLQLQQRATDLGGELLVDRMPKNGPPVYTLIAAGHSRELANLISVATALRDLQ